MDPLELLSGDARSFRTKIWASHVHVHHARPDDLVGLLSLDDVDHLLTSTAIRTPAVRLAQDGTVLPGSAYTRSATLAGTALTGLVDGRKVLDLFESGATVVLQGLHRYWPPLTRLVKGLELSLGHPCQANAYLTPPGAQGFALHKDTHDVFVFQTHGRKQWEVHDEAGRHDVLLEPGVSMYLPTGTSHAARTDPDWSSLHVTLGINQLTWRSLLERTVHDLLAGQDEHLPAGYLDEPAVLTEQLGERLAALSAAVGGVAPADVTARQVSRFLSTRNASLRGGLRDRLALGAISDDTTLGRRPGSACHLVPDGERLRVLLGDRELVVPARLHDALAHVRQHETLRPRDLAATLDEQSRLVLCRRLVREGLLEVDG